MHSNTIQFCKNLTKIPVAKDSEAFLKRQDFVLKELASSSHFPFSTLFSLSSALCCTICTYSR